jgi:gamma-glutamylcyclotransferase (GGCT)/AIG2-like uncharacterized protein YtfP
MADKQFYFAFASNLSKRKISERGASFEGRVRASFKNYCLKFNSDWKSDGYGYANIEPHEGSSVNGALYTLSPVSMDKLDEEHINIGGHYKRITIQVVKDGGQEVKAITYKANDEFIKDGLHPSRQYLEEMLEGSDILPKNYVETLQELMKESTSLN